MSHNPNTINSQDELNTCNSGKRSSDVLVEAISQLETTTKELEKVKKENEELKKELKYMYNRENVYVTKFNIALDCVFEYSVRSNWKTTEEGESCYFGSNGYELAEETIDKLKKITKVDESKCERLQKQLDIAVKAIKAVLHDEFILEHADAGLVMYLTQAEYKIKELNK